MASISNLYVKGSGNRVVPVISLYSAKWYTKTSCLCFLYHSSKEIKMLSRKWGNFSIFAQDFQEGTQLYVLMSGQKASDH